MIEVVGYGLVAAFVVFVVYKVYTRKKSSGTGGGGKGYTPRKAQK